ncbi:MAG TPA: hypothetical protein VN643_27070 [Pyrinomonadaceae bacterium]|nr:hypothetical protein [Pyrinomonadaceae bacterium]
MIKTLAISLFLVACSFSIAAQDYSVAPGKHVGEISLGMPRDAVWLSLGKPTKVMRWPRGLLKDSWLGPEHPNSEETQIFLNVIYRARRVVQIEFNEPKYKTGEGISVDNTLAQFRAAYKRPIVKAFGYDDGEGSGYVGYYYDAMKRGIAFTFRTQDQFDARTIPEALCVHVAGSQVIVEPRGKPQRPTDEVPLPKDAASQQFQHASKKADRQSSPEIIAVINQFWQGLGELDAEKLKQTMDWPITIVEVSPSGRTRSLVMNNPTEFDQEFMKTPAPAREKHRSEFYGVRPVGFVVELIGSNLASVSYGYRLPRDIIEKDPAKGQINKAVAILRRNDRPGSPWRIIFITLPA